MNEPEKERILKMVADGSIRPEEAAQLLAALAPAPDPGPQPDARQPRKDGASHRRPAPPIEIRFQRPDGSFYTVYAPRSFFPIIWQVAKAAMRESARTGAQETWSGFKHIVRTKTRDVGETVRSRVSREDGGPTDARPTGGEEGRAEARRRVLQMVQNGRITADDADRLIRSIDSARP